MIHQNDFDIKPLELDKILIRTAEHAVSEGGKQRILSLQPRADLPSVKGLQEQTLSAYEMVMEDWKQNHKEAETHTEEKTDTLEN